jgi:hypothetical protein
MSANRRLDSHSLDDRDREPQYKETLRIVSIFYT